MPIFNEPQLFFSWRFSTSKFLTNKIIALPRLQVMLGPYSIQLQNLSVTDLALTV